MTKVSEKPGYTNIYFLAALQHLCLPDFGELPASSSALLMQWFNWPNRHNDTFYYKWLTHSVIATSVFAVFFTNTSLLFCPSHMLSVTFCVRPPDKCWYLGWKCQGGRGCVSPCMSWVTLPPHEGSELQTRGFFSVNTQLTSLLPAQTCLLCCSAAFSNAGK